MSRKYVRMLEDKVACPLRQIMRSIVLKIGLGTCFERGKHFRSDRMSTMDPRIYRRTTLHICRPPTFVGHLYLSATYAFHCNTVPDRHATPNIDINELGTHAAIRAGTYTSQRKAAAANKAARFALQGRP